MEKSASFDFAVKAVVAFAAILASGGVFYHYVVYLPEQDSIKRNELIEAQRKATSTIEEARQLAVEKEKVAKRGYDECLLNARMNHRSNRRQECGSNDIKRLFDCTDSMHKATDKQSIDRIAKFCQDNVKPTSLDDCVLPNGVEQRLSVALRDEERLCLEKAKIGY